MNKTTFLEILNALNVRATEAPDKTSTEQWYIVEKLGDENDTVIGVIFDVNGEFLRWSISIGE